MWARRQSLISTTLLCLFDVGGSVFNLVTDAVYGGGGWDEGEEEGGKELYFEGRFGGV